MNLPPTLLQTQKAEEDLEDAMEQARVMVAAFNNTNMVGPHPPTETDTVAPTTAPTTTAAPMGNNAVSEQAYTARRLLLLIFFL